MSFKDQIAASVSIIEPVGGHGGMDYYDFGLAHGLTTSGCFVSLYTCDKTSLPNRLSFSCALPFKGIYGDAPRALRAFRYLRGLIFSLKDSKRKGHSIIHLHLFHAGWLEEITIHLIRLFGFKLVITVHDVESFAGCGSHDSARRVFNAADRLIAHNFVSSYELVKVFGVPEGKIAQIPHGNYLDYTKNAPSREHARKVLGLSHDSEILLFFGQIKQVKGLDLLLEAVAKVRENRPNVVLLIAGKIWKDDFSRYQAIIDRSCLSGSIKLDIRYIPDEEAALYYAAADSVVLPYRKIYQSGVLLMAMSYSRAVIASDLPGMVEVIVPGETGFLFRNGDVNALADKLKLALSSHDLRERVAAAGYERVRKDFDWNLIGESTHSLYLDILRNGKK